MQKKNYSVLKKTLLLFLAIFILFLAASGVWIFTGRLTNNKIALLKILPLPVAFVGNEPLYISDFLNAKKVFSSSYSDAQINSAVLESKRYIFLANSLGAEGLMDNSSNLGVLEQTDNAKNSLKLFYNSDANLNKDVYAQANLILQKINNQENFAGLAKEYDQDSFTKSFGGNSEALEPQALLPEILKKIKTLKPGDTAIVPSRLGVHIIKIVKNSDNVIQVQQIFLTTFGFDPWVLEKLSNIKTKIIISM